MGGIFKESHQAQHMKGYFKSYFSFIRMHCLQLFVMCGGSQTEVGVLFAHSVNSIIIYSTQTFTLICHCFPLQFLTKAFRLFLKFVEVFLCLRPFHKIFSLPRRPFLQFTCLSTNYSSVLVNVTSSGRPPEFQNGQWLSFIQEILTHHFCMII